MGNRAANRTPDTGQGGEAETFFTAREAAAALGLNERTIRRAIQRGELAAVKHGKGFHIAPAALVDYQASRNPGSTRRSSQQPHLMVLAGAGSVPTFRPLEPPITFARPRSGSFPQPPTIFIGRQREIADIAALVRTESIRLLTLIGPGGAGKTRLAIQVAAELAAEFADGAAYVDLAPIRDPALVVGAIAAVFGVQKVADQALVDHLSQKARERHLLLVIDNFEQVQSAAPLLTDLIVGCPRLTVLVTSRSPLHLSRERRYFVPTMCLPTRPTLPVAEVTPTEILSSDAVQLFVERVRTIAPDLPLTDTNVEAMADICRQLDGLPLAIELAAARTSIMSPPALLARLSRRMALLTGGPHDAPARLQTMHSAIAWSHDMLAPAAQALFRRLAIFVGGFTLDAAEAVGGDLALDLVTVLWDQSLLNRSDGPNGEPRFVMLETIREFALDQLAATNDADAARHAHASYYLGLADTAASAIGTAASSDWMRRLAAERSNLGAALDWLEQHGRTSESLRMTGALWHYWYRLGDLTEGRTRLERALGAEPSETASAMRARALRGAGVLAWQSGDFSQSQKRLEAALSAYRTLGDRTGTAWVLNSLGCLLATMSVMGQPEAHLKESLGIFRDIGDPAGIAQLTANLGELAASEGHHDLAREHLDSALAMWTTLGDPIGAARTRLVLARSLLALDDLSRVEPVVFDALAAVRDTGYEQLLPAALRTAAQVVARRGDSALAARWYGAEASLRDSLGMELSPARHAEHERHVAAVLAVLGMEAFAEAWNGGHRLSAAQVIAEVLDRGLGGELGASGSESAASWDRLRRLSAREREVVDLLIEGYSDKQIAESLFITRATASKHVAVIRKKLGISSRAAVVALVLRADPDRVNRQG